MSLTSDGREEEKAGEVEEHMYKSLLESLLDVVLHSLCLFRI